MGKAAKAKKRDERMRRKRAAKEAKRAAYKAMAGTSRKRKRAGGRTGPTPAKGSHAMSNCGNVGCRRCFPQFAPTKYKKGVA